MNFNNVENLFITSDEHYNHFNIIKMCNRPYYSVDEMNEALINNHNCIVGDDDITIHLGDFIWKGLKFDDIVYQLNGYHIFIKGNHDHAYPSPRKDAKYEILENQILEFKYLKKRFVACHYPFYPREWNGGYHRYINLYGHTHRRIEAVDNAGGYHVGVDTNDWKPVNLNKFI